MNFTNNTKALIISAVNAVIGLIVVFGVGLSEAQIGAILLAANALLALAQVITYKNSPKRIPDS